MVKKGLGVSILPASIAENYSDGVVGFYPIKLELYTEVLLTTPKGISSMITEMAIEKLIEIKEGN